MRGGDPEQLQQFGAVAALFPACAGVIPLRTVKVTMSQPFPRMRGGDPDIAALQAKDVDFSPHARG